MGLSGVAGREWLRRLFDFVRAFFTIKKPRPDRRGHEVNLDADERTESSEY
jgi:hypothetical protein